MRVRQAIVGILMLWTMLMAGSGWAAKTSKDKIEQNLETFCYQEKCGYLNASGRVVIEPQFDEANRFAANGLAEVTKVSERIVTFERTGTRYAQRTI